MSVISFFWKCRDTAIQLARPTSHHTDGWAAVSGKTYDGALCVYTNNKWCCCHNLELLFIKGGLCDCKVAAILPVQRVHPMLIVVVYISPGTNVKEGQSEHYLVISNVWTVHPPLQLVRPHLCYASPTIQTTYEMCQTGTETGENLVWGSHLSTSGMVWAHKLEYVQRGCYIQPHHRFGGICIIWRNTHQWLIKSAHT